MLYFWMNNKVFSLPHPGRMSDPQAKASGNENGIPYKESITERRRRMSDRIHAKDQAGPVARIEGILAFHGFAPFIYRIFWILPQEFAIAMGLAKSGWLWGKTFSVRVNLSKEGSLFPGSLIPTDNLEEESPDSR